MKRQLLCICVSAALLAGCTGDGETTVPDRDGRVPLQVNSGSMCRRVPTMTSGRRAMPSASTC